MEANRDAGPEGQAVNLPGHSRVLSSSVADPFSGRSGRWRSWITRPRRARRRSRTTSAGGTSITFGDVADYYR